MRLFLEHHVDEQVVADVALIAGADVLEVAMALAGLGHDFVGLVDHFEGVVVADRDALGAALALRRVDDDLEHAARQVFLLGAVVVLLGFRPLLREHRAVRLGDGGELRFERVLGDDLAEDGGIGALRDAVHAAGAVAGDVLGDFRGDVAEVAQRGCAGGNQRAGETEVGRQQLLAIAFLVAADDALVEIDDVEQGQADKLVLRIDKGAEGVIVEGVLFGRLVH